jgi:hypothetical protein
MELGALQFLILTLKLQGICRNSLRLKKSFDLQN